MYQINFATSYERMWVYMNLVRLVEIVCIGHSLRPLVLQGLLWACSLSLPFWWVPNADLTRIFGPGHEQVAGFASYVWHCRQCQACEEPPGAPCFWYPQSKQGLSRHLWLAKSGFGRYCWLVRSSLDLTIDAWSDDNAVCLNFRFIPWLVVSALPP